MGSPQIFGIPLPPTGETGNPERRPLHHQSQPRLFTLKKESANRAGPQKKKAAEIFTFQRLLAIGYPVA